MKKQSRRNFFKAAGLAGGGLAAVLPAAASSDPVPAQDSEMGMLYDATRCVGCKACMAAC